MPFNVKELSYLLKTVRDRMTELSDGIHRYYLNRRIKSTTKEELLPEMKEELSILTSLRNKLWRMKSNVQAHKSKRDEEG
jgi:hypothetical protein